MIPNELNITLADSAAGKNAGAEDERSRPSRRRGSSGNTRRLLEGLSRNAGVHAAGVVIGDRDLSEYVPLCRDAKGNDVISQYRDGAAERSRHAEDGFPRAEDADRHRGRRRR